MHSRKRPYASLKAWREEKKYTLQQAADFLDIPLTTYYGIERGNRPKPELMKRIMDRTGVTSDVLARVA